MSLNDDTNECKFFEVHSRFCKLRTSNYIQLFVVFKSFGINNESILLQTIQ